MIRYSTSFTFGTWFASYQSNRKSF